MSDTDPGQDPTGPTPEGEEGASGEEGAPEQAASAPPAPGQEGGQSDGGAAAGKRPRGLVRWGVLAALVVVPLVLALVLKDTVAHTLAERLGSRALGAQLEVGDAHVALFASRVTLEQVKALDRDHPEDELFSAAEASFDFDLLEALRGRLVIDELRLSGPRGKVVRRKDGSIGAGERPGRPPEEVEPGEPGVPGPEPGESEEDWRRRLGELEKKREELEKKRDFADSVVERLRQLEEWLHRREQAEAEEEGGVPPGPRPSGRAELARADRPRVVVHRIVCEGLELTVRDEAAGAPPLQLADGKLIIENLSSEPLGYPEPVLVDLQSGLADAEGALLELAGRVDASLEALQASFDVTAEDLPAHLFDPLLKDTLPLEFQSATKASLAAALAFADFRIDLQPVLVLKDIAVTPRDPAQDEIAGLDAEDVVKALREVGRITLSDIRVHGSVFAPEVSLGDTLQRLVREGGKAYAERKAREEAAALQEQLEERLRQRAEEGGPLGDVLGAGEGVLGDDAGEAGDKAKEKAKDALRGLFGGSDD